MKRKLDVPLFVAPILGFILGFRFLNSLLVKLRTSFVVGDLTPVQFEAYNVIVKYYLPVLAGFIAMLMWVFVVCIRLNDKSNEDANKN